MRSELGSSGNRFSPEQLQQAAIALNVPLEQLSLVLLSGSWSSTNQEPNISSEGLDYSYNNGFGEIAPNQSAAQLPIDTGTSGIHNSGRAAQEQSQALIGLDNLSDHHKPAWDNFGLPEAPLWLGRDLSGATCSFNQAVGISESNTIPSLLDSTVSNNYGEHAFALEISPPLQKAWQNTDISPQTISNNYTLTQPWSPMLEDLQNQDYALEDGSGQPLDYPQYDNLGQQQSALSPKTSDHSGSSWAHLTSPSSRSDSAVVVYQPAQSELPKWPENQESMWEAVMSGPCSHVWLESPQVSDTCVPNANADLRRLSKIPQMIEVKQTEKNVDWIAQITTKTHQGSAITLPIGPRLHGRGI